MKKIFFSCLIVLAMVVGISLGVQDGNSKQKNTETTSLDPPQSPALSQQQPSVAPPKRLIIEKLNVDANVEHVAEDEMGRMDIPKNSTNTAWYSPGYMPGEVGNAVIAGHLDNQNGSPSVFYNLNYLAQGDEIKVVDELGREQIFEVTGKKVFSFNLVPIADVFGQSAQSRLNLITCEGLFDRQNYNYSKRLVVYSSKVNK